MRTEQQHNERKQEIMEKCFECYAENGLTGTGIKALAAACNCTTGNLYCYFNNLDELIIESTAYCILSASVRSDSDPILAAIASGTVIFINISLDLIFMQVLNLGVIGASASLCIAETMGVLVLLTHFFKKSSLLKLRIAFPKISDIKSFVSNGFGVGSSSFFAALVMLIFNTLLLRLSNVNGALCVAIYGVLYTVGTIPGGLFEGISGALSTVTAFTSGESDTNGIFAVRKRALLMTLIFGGVLAFLCAAFPDILVGFFGIKSITAAKAMRIFAISIVFTGINTVLTAFWQSVGRAGLAGAISVIRNCILENTDKAIVISIVPKIPTQ